MKYMMIVDIGEKTCKPMHDESDVHRFCPFLSTSHYGTRFHCGLFVSSKELKDENGWLMRSDECLKTLRKVE